ncbi:hypothetical protein CWE09_01025 [Aliidiomarina minuta]|uniref:Type II secretion system protein GspF domain-containing protein n=1 Tax=Aliidiomarina minuta TaxID=880057 RepID=A0A432W5U2_9GAMM|nr:type II secretion system F family protein [Aliidiomarina minuta]RUO25349.1 hypothetical protein CWE09_01025 [Aliidiomarina minuta]
MMDKYLLLATLSIAIGATGLVVFVSNIWFTWNQRLQQQAQRSLSELFLFTPLRDLLTGWLIFWITATVFMVLVTQSLVLSLCSMIAFALFPLYWFKRFKKRRASAFYQQLPDALLLLSSSLRSGSPLLSSLQLLAREMPAPLSQEFTLLVRRLRLGEPFSATLDELLQRLPSVDLERVVIALKLAHESGGQQADLLEQLSLTMRSKQQLQQRVVALTSQGRLQGKVMTALPLLMAIALWFMEKPTMQALAVHPLGWISAAVLLVLLAAGYWVVHKLVHIEVPL